MTGIPVLAMGPFDKGVADSMNVVANGRGVMRYARNGVLDGLGRLRVRKGTQLAITLMDDQGSPAACTTVCAVVPFQDGCLAVGHSSVTQKFYLYWLNDLLSGWYTTNKVFTASAQATNVGVLWTGAASPAPITIAEGLGVAYIAHSNAGATFKTQKFDASTLPATLAAFQANLDGGGNKDTYFRGVVSFQQALWGWGYGSQAAGDNDRPELLRFSQPFFGPMAQVDNYVIGHRVRSQRERVVAAAVGGEVLFAGTNYSLWGISGFGRDTWDRRPIDDSYGFAGIFAMCAAADGYLYYASHRGPMRVRGVQGPAEPLWPRLSATWPNVTQDTGIVCLFDDAADQVLYLYQNGSSGRVSVLAAYDIIREAFLGPDGDVGLGVYCAAIVSPASTPGPAGPPTAASTTAIGNNIATANWTNGDVTPGTQYQVRWRVQGTSTWVYGPVQDVAGASGSFQLTGLTAGTAYEWAVANIRNGQTSAYLGPSAATQFTTTTDQLSPPTNIVLSSIYNPGKGNFTMTVQWTNSGDSGVSTEVYITGPTMVAPTSGTLPLFATAGVGQASVDKDISATQTGRYWAEVRHVRTGATPSVFAGGPAFIDVEPA